MSEVKRDLTVFKEYRFYVQDNTQEQSKSPLRLADFSFDERERLVGAFAWLIKEDKKQNPALYQHKKPQDD